MNRICTLVVTVFLLTPWGHAAAEPLDYDVRNQLQGIARASRESVMRTEVAGVVSEVHVVDGQWVAAGEPLMSLSDGVARAAWKAARAQAAKRGAVDAARLRAELAQRQVKRLEQAFREGASSHIELEERRSQRDQAMAEYQVQQEEANSAQANLELAAAELSMFQLKAPFDGQVVRLDRKQGQSIDRSESALMIVDCRRLEVEMYLPIELFGTIKANQEYTLFADVPVNRALQATARYASPIVDSTSGTFRVVFDIANDDQLLPAGFAVRLKP